MATSGVPGPAYPGAGPGPAPAGGLPPVRPRTSHVGLVIGLVGGFCALVLIGRAIGGYAVWRHHEASRRHSQEQATVHQRIGRPTGFTEEGAPRLRPPTWLSGTWTASSGQGDPVNATTAWLDRHMKATPPGQRRRAARVRRGRSVRPRRPTGAEHRGDAVGYDVDVPDQRVDHPLTAPAL